MLLLALVGRGRSCSQASSMASTRRLTGCSAPRALHRRKAWLWAERAMRAVWQVGPAQLCREATVARARASRVKVGWT